MASPERGERDQYVALRVPHGARGIDLYIERAVLEQLEPDATEMFFVVDISRRYKLRFDRPVRELTRHPDSL